MIVLPTHRVEAGCNLLLGHALAEKSKEVRWIKCATGSSSLLPALTAKPGLRIFRWLPGRYPCRVKERCWSATSRSRLTLTSLYRGIEIHGVALPDHFASYPDFLHEIAPLVAQGRIKYAEELIDGFENIPNAFVQLFEGRNRGKLIVKVGQGA